MDILSYSSNVKTFSKNDVLNILLSLEVGASDMIGALESIKNNKLDLEHQVSSWVVTAGIRKHLEKQGFRVTEFVDNALFCANAVKAIVADLIKTAKEYRDNVWDGKLLTLKQVNLLNLAEYCGFWLRYTRTVFDVLVTMVSTNTEPSKYLSQLDFRWVNSTELFYRQFTSDLMKGSRHLVTELNKIQDVEVTQSALDVLEVTEGLSSVDLLKKGFGVHLVNPVFWVALGKSKIQIFRIDQMRRQNEQFAMKISQAVNRRNGSNDPQLDNEIEIYQNAIIKNDYLISEIEKDYA